MTGFILFDTAIGHCGLVWGPDGLLGTLLPDVDPRATRRRLARRHPEAREMAPDADVQDAIDAIRSLLREGRCDLRGIRLDMGRIADFPRRVYGLAREIPPGSTLTYGEVATRLGPPAEARAVGQALGANPFAIVVPCHRVLAAAGRSGGFSAPGGVRTKLRLLQIEGAVLGGTPGLFDDAPAGGDPKFIG